MRDYKKPAPIAKVLSWAALAFLMIFPVLTVNSTSSGMRLGWLFVLSVFVIIGLSAHTRTKSDAELRSQVGMLEGSSYASRYRPIITVTVLGTLGVAEVLAVTATYAAPERPFIWSGTILIAQWGEAIFPIVGKYATQITPPLAPQMLNKAQAVTTLFLTAGAILFIIYVTYIVLMPHRDTRVMEHIMERMGYGSSPTKTLLLLPFAILIGITFFSGWLEFSSDPENVSRKRQFILATNHVRDDLALFAISFLRIFGSYGLWLGALSGAIQAFTSDREQT